MLMHFKVIWASLVSSQPSQFLIHMFASARGLYPHACLLLRDRVHHADHCRPLGFGRMVANDDGKHTYKDTNNNNTNNINNDNTTYYYYY